MSAGALATDVLILETVTQVQLIKPPLGRHQGALAPRLVGGPAALTARACQHAEHGAELQSTSMVRPRMVGALAWVASARATQITVNVPHSHC